MATSGDAATVRSFHSVLQLAPAFKDVKNPFSQLHLVNVYSVLGPGCGSGDLERNKTWCRPGGEG